LLTEKQDGFRKKKSMIWFLVAGRAVRPLNAQRFNIQAAQSVLVGRRKFHWVIFGYVFKIKI
jgi:hypothetical protein